MLASYTTSEEETFPVLENLIKTLGTITKVLLNAQLTSMRVNRFASFENIVTRF